MTTEERNKILSSAFIPERLWEDSYITDEGVVFTPRFNESGEMIKNGEEAYEDWLANKRPTAVTLDLAQKNTITPEQRIIMLQNQIVMMNQEIQNIMNIYGIEAK